MKEVAKKLVAAVVFSLKNILEKAHAAYGDLSRETAELVAVKTAADHLNGKQTARIGDVKMFMLSVRDLILQMGRWETAKIVWTAPSASKDYKDEDLSFMRRLPFGTMFVEGPVHAFGRDAAGFFISAFGDRKEFFMITFVFMENGSLAYSRTIEINSTRPRSCSISVRYPEAVFNGDGTMSWDFPLVIPFRAVDEYDLHAVKAEQAALGVLKAIYDENLARCSGYRPAAGARGHGGLGDIAAGGDGEGSGRVPEVPDFRFFGGTGSGKDPGTHGSGERASGQRVPHPVPASDSHRWHRVPGNDMSLVTPGTPVKWKTIRGEERLYQLLPTRVREYHTGLDRLDPEKTPIRIRKGDKT